MQKLVNALFLPSSFFKLMKEISHISEFRWNRALLSCKFQKVLSSLFMTYFPLVELWNIVTICSDSYHLLSVIWFLPSRDQSTKFLPNIFVVFRQTFMSGGKSLCCESEVPHFISATIHICSPSQNTT